MAIIGAAGGLGSAIALTVGQTGLMEEIKLIDIKKNVVETHFRLLLYSTVIMG